MENKDKIISEFLSITNFDNKDKAIEILESCNWDMSASINTFLQLNETIIGNSNTQNENKFNIEDLDNIRAPDETIKERIVKIPENKIKGILLSSYLPISTTNFDDYKQRNKKVKPNKWTSGFRYTRKIKKDAV